MHKHGKVFVWCHLVPLLGIALGLWYCVVENRLMVNWQIETQAVVARHAATTRQALQDEQILNTLPQLKTQLPPKPKLPYERIIGLARVFLFLAGVFTIPLCLKNGRASAKVQLVLLGISLFFWTLPSN